MAILTDIDLELTTIRFLSTALIALRSTIHRGTDL